MNNIALDSKEISDHSTKEFSTKIFQQIYDKANEYQQVTQHNPNVGAAIVYRNQIIALDAHKGYGQPHAEVNVIKTAQQIIGSELKNSILYVSLEPCSTQGKTPPCTQLIIDSGIKEIHIAICDPNPKHYGRGVKILQDHGVKVHLGYNMKKFSRLIEGFYKTTIKKEPLITSKIAQSLDGKIACHNGVSKWITSEESREHVQSIRAHNDAIITGIGTAIADNPLLNVRNNKINIHKQPTRIILDNNLRISLTSNLVQTSSENSTIIFTTSTDNYKKTQLKNKNVTLIESNPYDINQIIRILYELNYKNILIEAGAKINTSFFKNDKIDNLEVFIAPFYIGNDGKNSLANLYYESPNQAVKYHLITHTVIDNDIYISYSKNNYINDIIQLTEKVSQQCLQE